MRLKWVVTPLVLSLCFLLIIQGCAQKQVSQDNPYREPAAEFFGQNPRIYKYHGLLKPPPIRHLLEWVAKKGLVFYMKQLPLEKEVRDRVIENLKSEKFSKYFVPFVLAMVDNYVANKKAKKQNFTKYIIQNFPDKNAIPGLEHSLFSYDLKKKKKEEPVKADDNSDPIESEDADRVTALRGDEGGAASLLVPLKNEYRVPHLMVEPERAVVDTDRSHEAILLASVITILDAIILENKEFTLSRPPLRLESTINSATPATQKLLDHLKAITDPKSASYPALETMSSTPERVRGMAAALIDIIHYFTYKHYQMFAARYQRKEELREQLARKFDTDPSALARELLDQAKNKKFGVQILVDGLEGHLTEALALGQASSPFLTSVYTDKKNRESNRPKSIPYNVLEDTQDSFFEYLMKQGSFNHPAYLPFFRNLYKSHANGIARSGNTTTPTISARNVPIIQTGAPVEGKGATNLVNMHFINRKEDRAYYFFGNDAILQSSIAKTAGMQTLAERLPKLDSLNCSGTFEAGYHWSLDPVINITLGEGTKDFGEILCLRELSRRAKNETRLTALKKKFASLVKKTDHRAIKKNKILDRIADLENEALPQLLTFFFPWVDHFSHFKGPVSDEIIGPSGEMNRLDYWLARTEKIYADAGTLDRTLFVMAGDHGLTPVRYLLNPEKAVYGSMNNEGFDMKVNKISSDEGEGPKLTNPLHPPTQHGYDVVVASTAGGNYMVDFFLDQDKNWTQQPVYSELLNYKLLNGKVIDAIHQSLTRLGDTLDFLVVREDVCSVAKASVHAAALRDGKESHAIITREGNRLFYESESDLMQVRATSPYNVKAPSDDDLKAHQALISKCLERAKKDDLATWCNEDEWRDLTSYSPRPDSVVQLARLYDTDMAGTMNLFPAPYIGYNSIVPGRHAGELFMEKDAFVGFWGAPVKTKKRIQSAVNGSIAPTIYEYLSGKPSGGAANGWGYRSLFEY